MSIAVASPRSLLRVLDLDHEELHALLDLAARMKAEPDGWCDALPGRTMVSLFEKPSTRTRVSFAAAAWRLGMQPLVLRPDELQLGRGETIADTARVLSRYGAAIVLRTFAHSTLDELREHATVPVINALSDDHHPCQALADLLTLRERFGGLHGKRLVYVGDANNVSASLMEAGALAGMHVVVACPDGTGPDPSLVLHAKGIAEIFHGSVSITHDPAASVLGADAVYADVWVSMGAEAQHDEKFAALRDFHVGDELMSEAADRAVFMHCLPAHRGEEVAASVIDGPQSVVWDQAENRMHTEQALLYALITGDWDGSSR